MKTWLKIILLVLLALPAFSQGNDDLSAEEHEYQNQSVREKIRAAHVAYITDKVALTPEQAEKFWPIYNEFTTRRRAILRKIRNNPADNLELRQQALDLEKQYTEKYLTIITNQQLIDLRQAESDFRKLLLRRIQQRQDSRHRNNKR